MADSTATTNNLQITKDRVKSWAACSDGYRWFLGKFPEGAEFVPVYRALIADKRNDDGDLTCIRAAMVGQDGIKPDVWYELSADCEFVESEV